jgi:hypothetical protein
MLDLVRCRKAHAIREAGTLADRRPHGVPLLSIMQNRNSQGKCILPKPLIYLKLTKTARNWRQPHSGTIGSATNSTETERVTRVHDQP